MAEFEKYRKPSFSPKKVFKPVTNEEREYLRQRARDGVSPRYEEHKKSRVRLAKISKQVERLGAALDRVVGAKAPTDQEIAARFERNINPQTFLQNSKYTILSDSYDNRYVPQKNEFVFYSRPEKPSEDVKVNSEKNTAVKDRRPANKAAASVDSSKPVGSHKKLRPAETKITGNSYTVKYGDTLSKIAKRANMTVKELAEINNIADVNKIFVGDKIKLQNTATKNAVKRALAEQVQNAAKNAAQEDDATALAELARQEQQVPETAAQQMTSPGRLYDISQDGPFTYDYNAGYDQNPEYQFTRPTDYNYGRGLEWLNIFNQLSNQTPSGQDMPYMGYNSML